MLAPYVPARLTVETVLLLQLGQSLEIKIHKEILGEMEAAESTHHNLLRMPLHIQWHWDPCIMGNMHGHLARSEGQRLAPPMSDPATTLVQVDSNHCDLQQGKLC